MKKNFPSIPFTSDEDVFHRLSELGARLIDIHLLQSAELSKPVAKYQGPGSNDIKKVDYKEEENRVYINKDKYFEGIEPEVWHYRFGDYEVLENYLKERKRRGYLDSELGEPSTFRRIAAAIAKTIEIQKLIDNEYVGLEESLIEPTHSSEASEPDAEK
jgi:hypothetical protein